MENYHRMTVQGLVSGRHAALVEAAAEVLTATVPANVITLPAHRRPRLDELVAALTLDYEALPVEVA